MNKDAYYFSHDSNARHDIKIKAMLRTYGMEGYGRFWVIVELLREQSGYKLPLNEFIYETLAEECRTSADESRIFLNDCCNRLHLFESDGEYFWSESLLQRMEIMQKARQKKIDAGKRSAEARQKKKESQ